MQKVLLKKHQSGSSEEAEEDDEETKDDEPSHHSQSGKHIGFHWSSIGPLIPLPRLQEILQTLENSQEDFDLEKTLSMDERKAFAGFIKTI